ncbi:MAG: SRPBCC family protein [Gemmatimonadetes bacterium]|nr:SRPBCC family protein [Gemmatimonadota bacterium]
MRSPLPHAALLLALAAPLHAQERPMPDPTHVTRSATIHLHGTVAQVFPMFEPVGETRWAAGWSPRFLWPADGAAGVGTTFTTDEHGRESYWTIAEYEPDHRIVYSHLVPGSRSGRIEVRCAPSADGGTDATVRYDLTALGPPEHDRLLRMTDDDFARWLGEWETAINGALSGHEAAAHH